MDQIENKDFNFEILGFNLKYISESSEALSVAGQVIDLVSSKAQEIKSKRPSLANGEIAILLALELAKENIKRQAEYKFKIDKLQKTTEDALQFIEEATPRRS